MCDIERDAFGVTAWIDNQPLGVVYAGKVAYQFKSDRNNPCPANVVLKSDTTGIAYAAFSGCDTLEYIDVPSSVRYIGGRAFSTCYNLERISIPSSVNRIEEYTFFGCSKLNRISIPYGTESIGDYAFKGCRSLYSVLIPETVSKIGEYAFSECTDLESIIIPDKNLDVDVSSFRDTAWLNNQPEGVIYFGKIAYCVKGSCPVEIILAEGTLGMAARAFRGCTDLKSAVLAESTICISDEAFSDCINLQCITIPESVTTIGSDAFYYCTNLKDIYYGGSEAGWEK